FTIASCAEVSVPGPTLEETNQAQQLIDKGTLALRARMLDEAQAAFEVSYDLVPSPEALDGLGCVAFMRGELEIARDYFLSAYNQDSNYTDSIFHLALLYDYVG
ncbi:MAG: hypothetical protein CUN55_21340, partial [Phototrophicales bacterium]